MRTGNLSCKNLSLRRLGESRVSGTLLAWLRRMGDIVRRVDERDMGECLGKVAHHTLSASVVFLREQADVVAQADQPLKQALARPHGARSGHRRRRARSYREGRRLRRAAGRPRSRQCRTGARTRRAGAFARWPRSVPRTRGSSGGKKADLRDQQRARIQQVAVVFLGERAKIRVERPPADLLMDLRADPAPSIDRARRARTPRRP